MKTAIIILFHGSRAEGAGAAAQTVVAAVEKTGKYEIVTAAFLQYAEPDLLNSVRICTEQHAERIVVVPFFLQRGTHVTADIPSVLNEARRIFPDLDIQVSDAVGTHPMMAAVIADLVETILSRDKGRV